MSGNKVYRILFSGLFAILIAINSFCQSGNIEFDSYTTKDGLSNGYINSILQDSRGFIWIGTANGLNRFDGIAFKTYYFDPRDSTSIPGTDVTALAEDSLKNIWVMTSGGFSVFDRKLDYFSKKRMVVNGVKVNDSYIFTCFIDSKGFLWICASNGIYRLKIYNNPQVSHSNIIAESYTLEEKDVSQVYKNIIYSFVEDKNGKIWAASYSNKLYCFDDKQNRFFPQPIDCPDADKLSNTRKLLLKDHDGDFFITIEHNGLLAWYRDKNIFHLYKPDKNNTGPKGTILFALAEDKNGSIWIGDRVSEGVNIFDKRTEKFAFIRSDLSNPYSLNSNKINTFYQDKSGTMWVGANTGINKYSPGKSKFKRYVSDPNLPDRLSYNDVLCFTESKTGDIWVGTDGGGLNRLDRKTSKFVHYQHDPAKPGSLSSNAIISVCEDHDGTLWIGTYDGGLAEMKDEKFKVYYPDPSKRDWISDRNIWNVFEDSKRNLWVATLTSGLDLFDRETNRFYHYTHRTGDSTSLCNNSLVELYEDSKQNLYITSNHGISVLDLKAYDFSKGPPDIKFRNILHNDNRNSLSSNDIYCVMEDNSGNIWFGTKSSGIDKLDLKTGIFTNYSANDGLPGNFVSSILVDNVNNLWLATDKGLAKYNPETKEIQVFDRMDGLQNRSLRSWAIKAKDGEMFFGGPDGFNSFYPDQIKYNQNQNKPPVAITGFKIFNKPVKINEQINGRTILTGDISETRKIVLTYRENFFTFDFIALDYVTPEKNYYAYMMEGFDRDWVYCGTKHEANYTSLAQGEYTFRVKASNNDGVWNEEGSSIKVTILPPWWKTFLFRLSAGLISVFLITYFVLSRIRYFKKQKILLEELVREKTAELQESNRMLLNQTEELNELNVTKDKLFSIIAHDIRNPFSIILGFTQMLKENFNKMNDEEKQQDVSVLYSSAKNVFQLLENLLQWSRSQRGKLEFNPGKIELNKVLSGVIGLLKENAEAKNIELRVILPPEDMIVFADRQMLETILRNLISNAIKFTNKGGVIQISAVQNEKEAILKVTDNGVGIAPEIKGRLFKIDSHQSLPGTENEKGTGLGLMLVREFVARHGGEIGVESRVGSGSTFYFTLPSRE